MIPSFEEVMRFTTTVSGSTALEDADAFGLYSACLEVPRGGIVVETGCQLGRSSSLILQMARAIGFHSIHIDPYTEQPEFLSNWVSMMHRLGGERTREFTFLCMESLKSSWLIQKLGPIDMCFIDGDHEYPGVMIDLALIAEQVRPGGVLTAHDYTNEGLPGVTRAISDYMVKGTWDPVGVFGTLGVWRRQ
ncbi:MAG TPA: class I SAM-dependent methyltransferase [Candidatus Sulfotelmatobacter sp.]